MPRRKKEEAKKPRQKRVKVPKKSLLKVKNASRETQVMDDYVINLRKEEVIREIENLEKVERDKSWIMWSGVTFFMLVIGIIWIFNIKNVFEATPKDNTGINLDEITENFSKTMEEAKEGIAELKEAAKEDSTASATTTPASLDMATSTPEANGVNLGAAEGSTSTSTELEIEQADLAELRKKIDEIEKKLERN